MPEITYREALRSAMRSAMQQDERVFIIGEDVVHAKFGDGVVTGIEPGGLVLVRFAGEAAEKKLMADYAPLKRKGD